MRGRPVDPGESFKTGSKRPPDLWPPSLRRRQTLLRLCFPCTGKFCGSVSAHMSRHRRAITNTRGIPPTARCRRAKDDSNRQIDRNHRKQHHIPPPPPAHTHINSKKTHTNKQGRNLLWNRECSVFESRCLPFSTSLTHTHTHTHTL